MTEIEKAAVVIRRSTDVLVFSGAGVSAGSGIPTFRGSGGLWEKYNPAVYGNIPGLGLTFLIRKRRINAFARDALSAFVNARPNPAHYAIVDLENMGKATSVVTQNVDDLHREAGSSHVLELHGSIYRLRCSRCGEKKEIERDRIRRVVAKLEGRPPARRHLLSALKEYAERCVCGGRTRPDVVFFLESLPREAINEALERATQCDCLLAVGTSALVHPAASVPQLAVRSGARLIEVNPDPSPLTPLADVVVSEEAEKALPGIVEALKQME